MNGTNAQKYYDFVHMQEDDMDEKIRELTELSLIHI